MQESENRRRRHRELKPQNSGENGMFHVLLCQICIAALLFIGIYSVKKYDPSLFSFISANVLNLSTEDSIGKQVSEVFSYTKQFFEGSSSQANPGSGTVSIPPSSQTEPSVSSETPKDDGSSIPPSSESSVSSDSTGSSASSSLPDSGTGSVSGGEFPTMQQILYSPKPANEGADAVPVLNQLILPVSGNVTSQYGQRLHPIYQDEEFHKGVDLAVASGTEVKAALDGVVILVKNSETYGHYVMLQHSDAVETLYAHCSQILVEEGDVVKAGEPIAKSGQSGDATGPHLHFEVRVNGKNVPPRFQDLPMYSSWNR